MKIAVVHDDLMRRGGAEQVVLSMMKAFPGADLYTMCYQPDLTYEEFKQYKIKTSFYQYLVKSEKMMKLLFFPLGIISMKLLKITGYDVVLISNTFGGKYVSIDQKSKIFIYTYTPFRLAWNPESYLQYSTSTYLKRFFFNLVIGILRAIDKHEAQKGHYFLGMTDETAARIKAAYQVNEVEVIHPPVKCGNFHRAHGQGDFYLIVSRLEAYKKVDLAIKAFNTLGYKLVIVGNGSRKEELVKLARQNIVFKSGLSKEDIADLYANCKAFIFPQHEDYGITPLEANASGRPVIAYKMGGVIETMIPCSDKVTAGEATAIFFEEQTESSLVKAVREFEKVEFDPIFIQNHSRKFDEPVFTAKLAKFVRKNLN